MSRFQQALSDKDFVVTLELDPPRGAELGPWLEAAATLAKRVDAVVVSDNRYGVARMSPLVAALRLAEKDAEVILTLACRDRNRLALTSDLLGAAAAGVANLLLVSGDFPTLGDQPGSKPVYDLDSVTALGLAGQLMAGRDGAGVELVGAPEFFLGAAAAPAADPLEPQLMKLAKKLAAGAGFLITNPVEDTAVLDAFLARAPEGVPILAMVEADTGAAVKAAAERVAALRALGSLAGVHLSVAGDSLAVGELLDGSGL